MGKVQITVEVPAEQLVNVADNIFENVDDNVRAEIITKALAEVMKSPEMIKRDVEERASELFPSGSWKYEEYVRSHTKELRTNIFEKAYKQIMQQLYEDTSKKVLASKELKKVLEVIGQHLIENCHAIMVETMVGAMTKHVSEVLRSVNSCENTNWTLQSDVNNIKQKLDIC